MIKTETRKPFDIAPAAWADLIFATKRTILYGQEWGREVMITDIVEAMLTTLEKSGWKLTRDD